MNHFFNNLFNLLRLKAGPQDLPSSWTLTIIVAAVYVGQALITSQSLGGEEAAARSVISVAIQFLAVAVLLRFRGHPERTEQALLAFAGTGVILGLLAYGFLIQADPSVNQPVLAMVWFAIFGWSLAVDANIFRHALSVSLPIGVLITVVILAFTYVALEFAFK